MAPLRGAMRALVVADGEVPGRVELDAAWPGWDDGIGLVVAADGGAARAEALGLLPDLLVGDLGVVDDHLQVSHIRDREIGADVNLCGVLQAVGVIELGDVDLGAAHLDDLVVDHDLGKCARDGVVDGLLQHTPIEMQPRQFAVDEARTRAVGGLSAFDRLKPGNLECHRL